MSASVEVKEDSQMQNKPADSKWRQQKMAAWEPLMTPQWVVGTLMFVFVAFVTIGSIVIVDSDAIKEKSFRYDEYCSNQGVGLGSTQTCNITITFDEELKSPIHFYYELDGFYQNFREFIVSRSYPQLRGELADDISKCSPADFFNGSVIVPCGLISSSLFNDSFSLVDGTGSPVSWTSYGIAWESDRTELFQPVTPLPNGFTATSIDGLPLPSVGSEELMVWMRTAGNSNFRKLHRILMNDIPAGSTYTLRITNNFPVFEFNGKKSFVFATDSSLGQKSYFLGYCYLITGIICFLQASTFFLKMKLYPRTKPVLATTLDS